MNKIKTYLYIAFLSALIGVILNFIWSFISGEKINIPDLIYYMVVGVIFGTVTLITLSLCLMKIRKPIHAYLINVVVDAVLMFCLFLYQNCYYYYQWDNLSQWFIIGLASEILSTLLTAFWYHRRKRYNKKLAEKKKDLQYTIYKCSHSAFVME